MRKPRRYYEMPDLPQQGMILNPEKGFFSIIVPIARTNEVTNPSFETGTTGYTASGASIARSTTQSYHGAYSLAVTPTAALTDGAYYGTISTTAGQARAVSCKWKGAAGVKYKLSVATTGGVDLVSYRFIATGRWQWIWVYWVETSTTTRRIYFTKDSHASTAVFYIDGVQSEVINAGELVSTYIDGDQAGLLPNQFPYPYRWNGTPHASTSTRDITTRAGGYVVNLDKFRFKLMAYAGLGITLIANIASVGAGTDGSTYETTIANSRQFALRGRFEASTPAQLDRLRSGLYGVLGPDSATPRQPLVLQYQAFDGERERGDFGRIIASYQSGLEQNATPLPAEDATITFTNYLPALFTSGSGVALTVQTSVSNAKYILRRSPTGVWSALETGVAGGSVITAIAAHPNGTVYIGGDFTSAGASSADFAAIYDPTTNTFSVIKSATAFNGIVYDIAIGPNGDVYFAGAFTNVDGIAAADGIVKYTPSTNTFAALGTGVSAGTYAYSLAFDTSGNLYTGGSFATMGGVANTARIAKWDGAAWSALGTGGAGVGSQVSSILAHGNYIYAGGTFTSMGGVATTASLARYNVSSAAWESIGAVSAASDIQNFAAGPNGLVYLVGNFTTLAGLSISYIAVYNGASFAPVGLGTSPSAPLNVLEFDPSGLLYIGGQTFSTTTVDGAFRWTGGAFTLLDADLPNVAEVFALATTPDGTLYIGYDESGTATAAGITTVTYNGTARAYPTVTIIGPSSGASRIYQLLNLTTGKAIYLDLGISAGETITLRTTPNGTTLSSTFQGDISSAVLPGSSPDFALAKGANSISFFAASSSVTALMTWNNAFQSAADLTN